MNTVHALNVSVKQQQQITSTDVAVCMLVNACTCAPYMFAYSIHGESTFACSHAGIL